MNKWIKLTIKLIAGLAVLLLVVLYFSISKIDTTPYFESDYYKNTIENLDKEINNKKTSKGPLLAGFASVNITPILGASKEDADKGKFSTIKLAGFGDGKIAIGVHDSIFAKAIALEVENQMIVLMSADLLMMPEAVVEKILENINKNNIDISREQLFFGATHTHSSIGNCVLGYIGKAFGGEFQPEVVEWLSEKFTQVILTAVADKRPANIGSGYIQVPNLVRNRIIGETGRLNDKLTIVSIKQDSARTAAVGIYSAHATIIGDWNDQFSGDYPGVFQNSLENQGVDMAMFFAGTVGSHTNKGIGGKFDKVKYIGNALADSAQVVIDRLKYSKASSFSSITTEIEIPKLQIIHISKDLRLSPFIGKKLMPELSSILLQGFQLNDLIWTAVPYELSGEYAIDLKNALELKGYNSAFTSFNGQYLGYIVPAKYYYYDTYEARLMGWYGPSMGDYLMELNYKLANSLTNSKL